MAPFRVRMKLVSEDLDPGDIPPPGICTKGSGLSSVMDVW